MTTLGAAVVFFMRKEGQSEKVQKAFLGFAAGVMIAASVWSLLIPAINEAEALGRIGWIPAAGGFALGVLFLMGLDKAMPYFLPEPEREEGVRRGLKRSGMLIFAITLHNIPEGMELMGTVRNVIDFGAFVDIGVHEDGLVHISQMCDRYIKHPLEVVKVGEVVKVWVLNVDLKKKRISLTMKKPKV